MNASNDKTKPIIIYIEFGRKKPASPKKNEGEESSKLLKGQMRLTQTPYMSPNLGRELDEGLKENSVKLVSKRLVKSKNKIFR